MFRTRSCSNITLHCIVLAMHDVVPPSQSGSLIQHAKITCIWNALIQYLTLAVLWWENLSFTCKTFFFAFCNGKENRRHAFQYVWMKKSQSFSYENSSTCNVVSRNIASRGNSRGRNATKQYLSCKSNALLFV